MAAHARVSPSSKSTVRGERRGHRGRPAWQPAARRVRRPRDRGRCLRRAGRSARHPIHRSSRRFCRQSPSGASHGFFATARSAPPAATASGWPRESWRPLPPSLVSDARDGRFRADLLRRFGGQPITLPPLSIRPEDVPAIVPHIAAELAASANRVPPSFTQPALTVLSALQWPGNVSHFPIGARTCSQRFAGDHRSSGGRAADDDGGGDCGRPDDAAISLREARRRFEREYIATVLEQHQWRMSDAARTLGIERANLYRKARQLGISREETRTERTR